MGEWEGEGERQRRPVHGTSRRLHRPRSQVQHRALSVRARSEAAQEGPPCGGDGARGRRGAAQDDVRWPMGRAEEETGSEGMRCASLVVPPRAYARVVYENRRCGVHALSRPRIGLYHTRNVHSADGTSPRTMVGGTERARCIDPCYVASHVLCDVTTCVARHQSAQRPPRRMRYLGTTAQHMRTASPFITRPGAVVCRAPSIVCVNSARSRGGDWGSTWTVPRCFAPSHFSDTG